MPTTSKKMTVGMGSLQGFDIEMLSMPGHLIRRMHQSSQAIFYSLVCAAGYDLTSVQFAALSVIAAHPGLDQATLANQIAFDRATTGGVIDRLEAKGLVRRQIPKADRRTRNLYLEPAGRETLEAVMPLARQAQDGMLEGLSPSERHTLVKLLGKALAAVGDVNRKSDFPAR